MDFSKRNYKILILTFIFVLLSFITGYTTESPSKAFIWEVSSETSTVYILGSMHFANEKVYPLNNTIEKAFAASDKLVLELNPLTIDQKQAQSYIQRTGYYSGKETIRDNVSPEIFTLLQGFVTKHGLQITSLDKMKPGLLSINLASIQLMGLGYTPELGIDIHFAKKAENSKPIIALETLQEQLSLLFTMPNSDRFLHYTLLDLDNTKEFMAQTISAWQIGDTDALYDIMLKPYMAEEEFQPLLRRMFYNRNMKMAVNIEKYLKTDQDYFVVVGAGHLIGEKGIISLLQNQKYSIKQLNNE
ncbi:MAG: TraB/GumN family protein [Desulfotalea sp.]